MNNIQQFSIYTAKVFDLLYDSFPIHCSIDTTEIIKDFLSFDQHEELKDIEIKVGIGELLKMTGRLDVEKEEKLSNFKAQASLLSSYKEKDISQQQSILSGTIEFLEDEALITFIPEKGYRLTAKAFSHLNKNFTGCEVKENDKSHIELIKNIFSGSVSLTREIIVGSATAIIPSVLGYS